MSHTSCIITTSYRNPSGYGQTWVDGKLEYTHRVAFAKANSLTMQDLKGKVVMHKCDNPGCMNPEHLILGTHEGNAADRHAKGRTRTGTTRGEQHHFNKLAAEDINDIRVSTLSQRKLAQVYGISQSAIMAIRTFRNWAHIPFQKVSTTTLSEIVQRQKEKLHEPNS